jgi:hypothetical protein
VRCRVLKKTIVLACAALFCLTVNVFAALSDTTDDGMGTISARGENLPFGEGAAQAFDNDTDTKWLDFNPSYSWIQYQYASDKRAVVTEYTLTSANDFPERDPTNWNLLGSNNGGASWDTLDTRTGELFSDRYLKRSFTFTNSTAYNIYRLEITQVRGNPTPNSVQLSEIELIGTPPAHPVKATNPNPANSAIGVSAAATLSWTAGSSAVSHDVYLGTNLNDVTNTDRLPADLNGNGIVDWPDVLRLTDYWLLDPAGSEPYAAVNGDNTVDFFDYALLAEDWKNSANPVFKGNQDANSFSPSALELDTTYYWRINEVNGPNTVTGDVWSFTTQPNKAFNPSPADSASNVAINAILSWSPGAGAASHNVYFGTTNPPASQGNQSGTTFNPGMLANNKTYYWRIDEVGSGTVTGDLWSFTTMPAVSANRRKGPYLIYPGNNTQMTVLWQVDVTAGCLIAWGTDTTYSTGNAATSEYGSDHQHKYNITGLTPGTKYYYRVTAGTNNWTGNFYAAPAAGATDVKFFMYGDTRTNGSSNNTVCGQMISTYNADNAYQTIVLHSGDWVESNSESTWTSQWYNYSWTNIVNATSNMPFMGCIGNHESGGSVFEKYHPYPFAAAPADYFSFDYGPVHIAVVDQYTSYTSGSAQHTWLVNDLSSTSKQWKIIVLHEPGWTAAGSHPNNTTVQSVIQPLCTQYGVDIVVGGHNHYYSRAVVSGVHHLTSGGGGAPLYTPDPGQPNIVTCTKTINCQKVAISGNTLTCTTINGSGSVIDTFTVNH